MDEAEFQTELFDLKNRIAQMTCCPHRRSPGSDTPSLYTDPFTIRLSDCNRKLQSMQASMDRWTTTSFQSNCPEPTSASFGQNAWNRKSELFRHASTPYDPYFMTLLRDLQMEFRGLGNRIESLENSFSGLEDRVDSLEPVVFTPTASEDGVAAVGMPESLPAWAARGSDAGTGASEGQGSVSPMAEGVAFRDREISRLEELLRAAQESLRQEEELGLQRDAHIERLRSECRDRNDTVSELERRICERDNTIDEYQSKTEALEALTRRQVNVQRNVERQKDHVQRLWSEAQADSKAELERRDEEIRRLREFCDAREAIVSEQSRIIAHGSQIIEDRDAELEEAGRQLRERENEYGDESRDLARLTWLLRTRDEEIAAMKGTLQQAQQTCEPEQSLSRDLAAVHFPNHGPKPIACQTHSCPTHDHTISALEQHRVEPWEERMQDTRRPLFRETGAPSPPWTQQTCHPLLARTKDDRRSESLYLLQRLGSNVPPHTNRTRPPSPAPLSPRKRASTCNTVPIPGLEDPAIPRHGPLQSHAAEQGSDA